MPQKLTPEIIIAAIAGFEAQKDKLDSRIAEIRSMLDGGRTQATAPTETGRPRKKFSAATRRKMAAAQRARFAKLKKGSEPTQAVAAKPKKRRKMSAAGRKRIAAAQRARWAKIKKAAA